MSDLTDLRDAIVTDLTAVIASGYAVDLTNQDGDGTSTNTTILNAVALNAARKVQRYLGRTVDDTDNDGIEFGTRIALHLLRFDYAMKLNDVGMAYIAGVYQELKEEATRRRQGTDYIEHADEDFDGSTDGNPDLDGMYNELTWDDDAS